ncbi:11283_t:CDS:2 [Acaulospora morrowiae]|uniref:11283_t:CDS:1 n=1 Tax=Acaulospora morrowiae TaxID=94023 RepID=A0A9N9AV82_9GLOM|nr:11283_t:CDS:2 [Acaulospora morrowiae]
MDTAVMKQDNSKKDQDLQREEDQLSYEQSKEQIDLQLSEEEISTHIEENNGVIPVSQSNGATTIMPKGSTPVKLNRNNYKASLEIITTGATPPSKPNALLQNSNNELRGTAPADALPQAPLNINNESGLGTGSRFGVSISKTRIFVGDLSWKLTEKQLKTEFDQFGTVNEVLVVKDRNSGLSKGYGFVSFEEKHAASDAIKAMNGQNIEGRPIRVEAAEERPSDDRYEKQQTQEYRRPNEYRKDIDYDRRIYYDRNRRERDNYYRNEIGYRRENDHKMEMRTRDIGERREFEPRREIEYRKDFERRRGFEHDRRERGFERRIEEGDNKRERRKQSLEPNETIMFSPKGQLNRNYMRMKDQSYAPQEREYERSCDQSVDTVQNDKDDKNDSQNRGQIYEIDLSDKNDDPLYNRNVKYVENEKDRNSSSRKRTRSNSINADDAYYSRSSDMMHVDSSPRTPSPHFESDPSQSPWHPSPRIPKKDYYIDGQSPNFLRKRDRGREREKDRGFDRENTRFLDRERQRLFDKGRERDMKIMERERDRQPVRPRDQPRYYDPERDPHRFRAPNHEYGRDAVRIRPPPYGHNREPEFREKERDLPRYKDTNRDSYYHRQSPPHNHLAYRDNNNNTKRFDDYYYQPVVYPTVRRSLSPRARYPTRRSSSPVVRPPHIPSYDRRDRIPRYDNIRNYDYDTRRENYYTHHYNEANHNGYVDHYAPPIHSSASNAKQFEENFGVGGRLRIILGVSLPGVMNVAAHVRDVTDIGKLLMKKPIEITIWTETLLIPWDANEEKSGNAKDEHKDCADAKSTYERQDTREKNDKYWDIDEDEGRDYDCNPIKNRNREKDNKERGEFDHILNSDSPISSLEFFPPLTVPTDTFNLQSSQSISNGHQKNNHTQHAHF